MFRYPCHIDSLDRPWGPQVYLEKGIIRVRRGPIYALKYAKRTFPEVFFSPEISELGPEETWPPKTKSKRFHFAISNWRSWQSMGPPSLFRIRFQISISFSRAPRLPSQLHARSTRKHRYAGSSNHGGEVADYNEHEIEVRIHASEWPAARGREAHFNKLSDFIFLGFWW